MNAVFSGININSDRTPVTRPKKKDLQMYQLGRTSAAIDQKNKELDQKVQLNTVQQVLLQTATLKIQDLIAELTRKQKDIEAMSGGIGGGMPPPPALPPNMSGAPVDMSQLQAPGGMPQGMPDMGGMPQGMPPGGMPQGMPDNGQPMM